MQLSLGSDPRTSVLREVQSRLVQTFGHIVIHMYPHGMAISRQQRLWTNDTDFADAQSC